MSALLQTQSHANKIETNTVITSRLVTVIAALAMDPSVVYVVTVKVCSDSCCQDKVVFRAGRCKDGSIGPT